ncbi:MAG: DNA repair protein RecN [Acidimicrobiales bacterium]|jgi:DNA repair protein RecN (Recombination protein N)
MLVELLVRDLGVIEEVRVELGPGMTALSGETGAGKTLLVEALDLLLGGRADPVLVRPGATEAIVEGRFVLGEQEVVLARAVPAGGRSRAWVDGHMAPVAALSELATQLVDVDGQHAHQSLLDPAAQRRALDAFGGIDLEPVMTARAQRAELLAALSELGGDERARAREADLLRYQLEEITSAAITGPQEDELLEAEEGRLAEATAHREAAAGALGALDSDRAGARGGVVDLLGEARKALEGRAPLGALAERLVAAEAEATDLASELRRVIDTWEDDPERLTQVQARRQLLRELSRKYGEGPGGVLTYAAGARERLDALESTEERAGALNVQLAQTEAALGAAEAAVGAARRRSAPLLAAAVEHRLRALAMARARIEVAVAEHDPGDEVVFGLGANPGEPVLALTKVASGGELARTMLALRLVLSDAPPTMVFDEVDAGIGGEAATAVGAALAEVGRAHQVLVVTHLAQVAAFASRQLCVTKEVSGGRTVARVKELEGEDRVVELARMLSGRPGSATARRHAKELLHAGTGTGAA